MIDTKFGRIQPTWDQLLPTKKDKAAFAAASAAMEAGHLVRTWRTNAGLTQAQLATKVGVTQARVSAIENGEGRDGPSYAVLKRLAAACEAAWPSTSHTDHGTLQLRIGLPAPNVAVPSSETLPSLPKHRERTSIGTSSGQNGLAGVATITLKELAKEFGEAHSMKPSQSADIVSRFLQLVTNHLKAGSGLRAGNSDTVPAKASPVRLPVTLGKFEQLAESHVARKAPAPAEMTQFVRLVADHLKAGERLRLGNLGILEVKNRQVRRGHQLSRGVEADDTVQLSRPRAVYGVQAAAKPLRVR